MPCVDGSFSLPLFMVGFDRASNSFAQVTEHTADFCLIAITTKTLFAFCVADED